MKSASTMLATITSCSTAILAAKCILHTVHLSYSIDIFTSNFAGKFYEQMVTFIQSRNLEFH